MSKINFLLNSINNDNVDFIVGALIERINKDIDNLNQGLDISDLCLNIPRINTVIDKKYKIAHKISFILYPCYEDQLKENKDFKDIKTHAYILYTQLISKLKKYYVEQEESKKEEYISLKNAEEMRINYDKYDSLPVKSAVAKPTPMPVNIAPEEELEDFFNFLETNKEVKEEEYIKFTRGTIFKDGRMDLCKQVVGDLHIERLMKSLINNTHIKHFLLGNNIMDITGARAIASFLLFPHKPKIETWYIAGNNVDELGIKLIAEALKTDTDAKSLWLKRNPLNENGVKYLGEMLEVNKSLEVLDLHNVNAGNNGIKYLFESLKKNTTLKRLYLDANNITVEGIKYIADYFNFLKENNKEGITSLWIGMNRLRDEGVTILANSLEGYNYLERLSLNSVRMKSEGCKNLLSSIKTIPNLILLDIGAYKATGDMGELPNYVGDEGADYISNYIKQNSNLQVFDFSENYISNKKLIEIGNSMKDNINLLYTYFNQYGIQINKDIKKLYHEVHERNILNKLNISYKEFHKNNLRFLKHTDDILKIDSIYRNKM